MILSIFAHFSLIPPLFFSDCSLIGQVLYYYLCFCSDNLDSNNALENSLIAKEKLISELNMELHNIETTLSNEREEHINDVKKFTAMLNEKVRFLFSKVIMETKFIRYFNIASLFSFIYFYLIVF